MPVLLNKQFNNHKIKCFVSNELEHLIVFTAVLCGI